MIPTPSTTLRVDFSMSSFFSSAIMPIFSRTPDGHKEQQLHNHLLQQLQFRHKSYQPHRLPLGPTRRMEHYVDAYGADPYADMPIHIKPDLAGVPTWAIWLFALCTVIIAAVLLLDYCVIRRNALGNTCCARARQKRPAPTHQKRSTNMLLNV